VQQIAGFLGLVSSEQSAGDKQNRGEITRVGDSRLRNKLIQSAWVAIRQDSELREFPFGSQSEVGSINNFGHLAGIAFDNPSGPIHGFIFGGSSFGRFDFPVHPSPLRTQSTIKASTAACSLTRLWIRLCDYQWAPVRTLLLLAWDEQSAPDRRECVQRHHEPQNRFRCNTPELIA
jgi:transposase IS116/IS110/IS902 family protein